MFRLVLASVRHNTGRYVATLVAIITGVAFYTATGFVSDRVIDTLEGDVNRQYGNVDVAVVPAKTDASAAQVATAEAKVSGSAADALLGLPGVDAGAGVLTGPVAFLGPNGKPFAENATGRLWVKDEELNPVDVESGRAPKTAAEIAVDRGLAADHALNVGQKVTLLTLAGEKPDHGRGDHPVRQQRRHRLHRNRLDPRGDSLRLAQRRTGGIPELLPAGLSRPGRAAGRGAPRTSRTDSRHRPVTEFRADQRDQIGSFGRILKRALQGSRCWHCWSVASSSTTRSA